MHLNEFAVGVFRALLVTRGNGAAGTNHRVRRLAVDQTRTTGRDDHRISRKSFQLERAQVHRYYAATNLMVVEDERHHFPAFVFLNATLDFKAAHLFIQRVQKLLAGRSSGKGGAMMFGAAEAPK